MAKLFVEKLQNLEVELKELKGNESVFSINKRLDEIQTKYNSFTETLNKLTEKILMLSEEMTKSDRKINQIINEISPIIQSHANALNALLGKRN